jgi:hypothetical protein
VNKEIEKNIAKMVAIKVALVVKNALTDTLAILGII